MNNKLKINFIISLIPLLTLIVSTLILVVEQQMPLFLSLTIAIVVAGFISVFYFKTNYSQMEEQISESIGSIASAIMILICVGLLSSAFIYSGIVPSLMYYSLTLISIEIYLPAIMVISAVFSLAIGSSLTAIATVGLALFSAGVALGFSPLILVGAIVSGAMFGDKLSPLSDTTNIAASKTETNLFTHIFNMLSDTMIAFILSLIVFTFIGFTVNTESTSLGSENLQQILQSEFIINPYIAFIPVLLLALTYLNLPVVASLLITTFVSIVTAIVVQGYDIKTVLTGVFTKTTVITAESSQAANELSYLFNRGGLLSMQDTITIIVLATVFGAILSSSGMFNYILSALSAVTKTTKSLILTTIFSAMFVAVSAGEQYLSIILPIDTFKESYKHKNISSKQLSRAVETGGTVVISLVPWGVYGVFIASVFDINQFSYSPFVLFAILTPFVTILKVVFTNEQNLLEKEKNEN